MKATNDTLRKRLGDIRSGEHGTDGVWARMYHGKLKGQSYTDKYHTYQLGYDKTRYDEKMVSVLMVSYWNAAKVN